MCTTRIIFNKSLWRTKELPSLVFKPNQSKYRFYLFELYFRYFFLIVSHVHPKAFHSFDAKHELSHMGMECSGTETNKQSKPKPLTRFLNLFPVLEAFRYTPEALSHFFFASWVKILITRLFYLIVVHTFLHFNYWGHSIYTISWNNHESIMVQWNVQNGGWVECTPSLEATAYSTGFVNIAHNSKLASGQERSREDSFILSKIPTKAHRNSQQLSVMPHCISTLL